MEYKIEERGFDTRRRGLLSMRGTYDHTLEFEDAQSMFDRIVDKWSETFFLESSGAPEISPSIWRYGHTLFFDETNFIKLSDYLENWACTAELIINDDEGNRVNIDSLSDLIGLEGVDSTGIIIRDGKIDPTAHIDRPRIIYDGRIEG